MAEPYLTTFDDDGWMLDDGEEKHSAHPDTFWIPNLEVRSNLEREDWAKLLFLFLASEPGQVGVRGERMWVEVEMKHGTYYRGRLLNTPVYSDLVGLGTTLWFEPRHVIDIVLRSEQDQYLQDADGG
jgi:hypothetical protein